MRPYHCFAINDVCGYIGWQNRTHGIRIAWDNADYGLFGCFCASLTLSGRHFYLNLGESDEPYS